MMVHHLSQLVFELWNTFLMGPNHHFCSKGSSSYIYRVVPVSEMGLTEHGYGLPSIHVQEPVNYLNRVPIMYFLPPLFFWKALKKLVRYSMTPPFSFHFKSSHS